MFSIQAVRATQFTEVFNNIRTLVNRGLVDPALGTLPKQAQLLTKHCMALTPPRNNKGNVTNMRIANARTHKEAGENAVARDINYIIKGRAAGYLESVISITGKSDNISQALRNKKGVTYLIDVDRIDESGGEIPGWHKKHRDSRGRINRSTKGGDDIIGRWRAKNRLWVPNDELDHYRKKKQAMVGWAKSGWLKAYLALKGTRAPDWVMRHTARPGTYINGLNTPRPFIQVGNGTRWGGGPTGSTVVQTAFAARTRAMQTFFNTMMRLASEGKPTQWQAKAMAAVAQQDDA